MAKRRIILSVKERALIASTFKKLRDSPSEIAKELGVISEQVSRDIYHDPESLIKQGLLEKSSGKLILTEKGRNEPLIKVLLETRTIGKHFLTFSFLTSVVFAFGFGSGMISLDLSRLTDQEFVAVLSGLILFSLIGGLYLYHYPKILLKSVKE